MPLGCRLINQKLVLPVFIDRPYSDKGCRKKSDENTDPCVEEIERELQVTRESLQATIEVQEAVNEELQSADEELVTVNFELQAKIDKMTDLNNDINNLLASTEIGTIIDITDRKRALEQMREAKNSAERIVETVSVPLLILDPDLKVLSADARFYHVFRTTRGKTENKRIYGLGKGQRDIRRLPELLEQIVPNNNSVDDFEVEHVFSGIGFKKMSLSAHLSRGKLQCRHDSHLHGRYYRFKLTWQRVHSHSHGIYNSND